SLLSTAIEVYDARQVQRSVCRVRRIGRTGEPRFAPRPARRAASAVNIATHDCFVRDLGSSVFVASSHQFALMASLLRRKLLITSCFVDRSSLGDRSCLHRNRLSYRRHTDVIWLSGDGGLRCVLEYSAGAQHQIGGLTLYCV